MKNILLAAIIGSCFCACNKSTTIVQNEGLIGKWQLTEYFISPEDAGAWHAAEGVHTIEFRPDGSFISNDEAYNGAIGYTILDSTRIKFLLPTQIVTEIECYYQLQNDNRTLILSPMGCIEGCSNKYKAIAGDWKNDF